jgi:predicted dehydrogenase
MLNWGVMGCSRIAAKVIPLVQNHSEQKILAIASRSLERAKVYAQKFNIERHFSSYEEMLNDSEIDAVYVSLPNDLHFNWCEKALNSRKHVLCEKPLTLSSEEVASLEKTAKDNNCILLEGFMYRHHRQIDQLKRLDSRRGLFNQAIVRANLAFRQTERLTSKTAI